MNGEALLTTSTSTLEYAELRLAHKILTRRVGFDDPLVEALLAVRSELERRHRAEAVS